MPITEEQRKKRIEHLGSSDMAAVLGEDRWKTPYDIFLEKRGSLVERPETQLLAAGNRFEDGVLDYAEDKLGPLTRNVERKVPDTPIMAHIDAIINSNDEPVEGKTTGLFGPVVERWGDDGTDEVPNRVIIQCHVHMLATGRTVCHVPTFIGGRGFCMFEVPYNEILGDTIREEAVRFWTEHVETGEPPEGQSASLDILKRMRRVPEKIVEVDPQTVQAWLEAKQAAADAEKAQKAAEAVLLTAMGDAEAAICGELGAVTYFETHRKGYEVKPTTYRTLRHKKKGL